MIQLLSTTIDERTSPQDLERVRRNMIEAIAELQQQPFAFARPIIGIRLEDGKSTPIAHNLGRPALVFLSPPRTPAANGRIIELRDGGPDRRKFFVLQASGWGATITVDALVL